MLNYESLGVYDLYKGRSWDENICKRAMDRIKEAWEDREIIHFHRADGTPIYVVGAENRKQSGEWFIEISDDGLPDMIIGGMYDLEEYMQKHIVDWFEVLEVK